VRIKARDIRRRCEAASREGETVKDGEEKEERDRETWTCPICEEENLDEENICQGCGAYREEPSYDATADDEDPN